MSNEAKWTLIVGTSVTILMGLVGLWFEGTLKSEWARWQWDDDAEQTVQQLLDELVAVGHAEPDERADLMDEARELTTDAVGDKAWKQWMVGSDPYVWTRLQLDSADESHTASVVSPAEGTVWAVRRAKSGCWELRGSFELARTRGEWRIGELPQFRRRCGAKKLAATWHGADERRGVMGWEGRPSAWTPARSRTRNHRRSSGARTSSAPGAPPSRRTSSMSSTRRATSSTTATSTRHGEPSGRSTTARGERSPTSSPSRCGCCGSACATVPDRVRSTRSTAASALQISRQGTAPSRSRSKSRPGSQRVDCDLGVVDSVSLTITGAFPRLGATLADTDVTLSHIDFWGVPEAAEVEQPPPSGPFAWSDVLDRPPDREDVAPCRSDPPPPELIADPRGHRRSRRSNSRDGARFRRRCARSARDTS